MNRRSLMRSVVLVWTLCCIASAGVSNASVIYVDGDASGANDGTSWSNAFIDLQDALGVAQDGDELRVAEGVYTPAGPNCSRDSSFELMDAVTLYGSYAGFGAADPDARDSDLTPTVLSGDLKGDDVDGGNISENSFHVVTAVWAGEATILDGFTIEGGNADGGNTGNRHAGGGILVLGGEPQISDCMFVGNRADYGGAIASIGGGATISGCRFMGNRSESSGGAMLNVASRTKTIDCVFLHNEGYNGGAVSNGSSSNVFFESCSFEGNVASGWNSYGEEMESRDGSYVVVKDSDFICNTPGTRYSEAMYAYRSEVRIHGCSFRFTADHERGSGIQCRQAAVACTESLIDGFPGPGINGEFADRLSLVGCTIRNNMGGGVNAYAMRVDIVNCLITGNETGFYGGGLRVESGASVTNCTIVGNRAHYYGAGIYSSGSGLFVNNVVWGNYADGAEGLESQFWTTSSYPEIWNCTIQGWDDEPGIGDNNGEDPLFVDAPGGDGIYGTEDDDLRLAEGSPCINTGTNIYLWRDEFDVDGDGNTIEDYPFDIRGGARVGYDIIDRGAYELPGDCNDNGISDEVDIIEGTSLDCNQNWIPDECLDIEDDCNGNLHPDQCDIAEEISEDCTGNHIPDECEPDCNDNSVADSCDLANGSSEDCNGDGVPDECSGDCDGNGVWDACDVFTGIAMDCNENLVPDQCESFEGLSRIYVDRNASGLQDGSSWHNAVTEVRAAFCLAHEYPSIAEIWVARGTYKPTEDADDQSASFVFREGLDLYGGFAGWEDDLSQRVLGENITILSGDILEDNLPPIGYYPWQHETRSDNTYHVVKVVDCEGVNRIDGITIHGGCADDDDEWLDEYGGGILIYNGHVVMSDCVLSDNLGSEGPGGIYVYEGSGLEVRNSRFEKNIGRTGGAIRARRAIVTDIVGCEFVDNQSWNGGGALSCYYCPLSVANTLFAENTGEGSQGYHEGGAVRFVGSMSPVFQNCVFTGNKADRGGGMLIRYGAAQVSNCTFHANKSIAWSSGGGAVHLQGDSESTFDNCIVWRNAPIGVDPIYGGLPSVTYSDVQGGMIGEGNIDADPLFVDPDGLDGIEGTEDDDLRLLFVSPCANAGSASLLPSDMLDLDDDGDTLEALPLDFNWLPRVLGDEVDMGAIEFWEDCDGNGVADQCDLSCDGACGFFSECGVYHDCNDDAIPDECCDADVDYNGNVGAGDINLIKAFFDCDVDGLPYCECARFDLDGSGSVGTGDLNIVKANYGPCGG